MDIWNSPESIFAPLVVAVPPDTDWAGFGNSAIAARDSIPASDMTYTVKRPGTFKKVNEIRDRKVIGFLSADTKPYVAKARLVDAIPGVAIPSDDSLTLWEVGISTLKDGLCTPAVPSDYDTGLLEVTMMRLTQNGQAGASQLALFRHLFAAAVKAASPKAIVFGGQYGWDDSWWNERATDLAT
jgi:hypothetical protein